MDSVNICSIFKMKMEVAFQKKTTGAKMSRYRCFGFKALQLLLGHENSPKALTGQDMLWCNAGFVLAICYCTLRGSVSPRGSWLAPFVFKLYWDCLAFSSFGFSAKDFSKKFTSACSVSREAKMCSKETFQSPSAPDKDALLGVFAVSVKTASWSEVDASLWRSGSSTD